MLTLRRARILFAFRRLTHGIDFAFPDRRPPRRIFNGRFDG